MSSNKLLGEHVAGRVELVNCARKRDYFGLEIVRRGRDPMNTVHEDRRAEAPVIDRLLQRRIARIEAAHETDLDEPFSDLRLGVHEGAALRARQRKRLFAQDRLSDADAFRHEIEMRVIGGSDENSVDVRVMDNSERVGLGALDADRRPALRARSASTSAIAASTQSVTSAARMCAC